MLARPSPRTVRRIYRRWLALGMPPKVAGNLTAIAVGLRAVSDGWTPDQIEALLFLRWLWQTGRIAR